MTADYSLRVNIYERSQWIDNPLVIGGESFKFFSPKQIQICKMYTQCLSHVKTVLILVCSESILHFQD